MGTWTLIDTETDGLYPPIHVIDIAAQRFDGLEPLGPPFQIYVDHGIGIPSDAQAIHGYTTDFIQENGVSPSKAYGELRSYVGGDQISAHYLQFDWDRVLVPELRKLKIPQIGKRGFCTWLLSRRALPEHSSHKLDFLRDTHGLSCSRPHTALGDVESVTDLLTRIIFPRLSSIGFDTFDRVREFSALKPILRCKCLIQGLSYEDEARKIAEVRKEKRRLDRFLMDVRCGLYSIPDVILDHNLIDENPSVEFLGKTFLFTGKMEWGSRSKAGAAISERGGTLSKSKAINEDIDYLVLGEDKFRGWTSLIKGGKLTKALLTRFEQSHLKYRIILEQDFVAALQD